MDQVKGFKAWLSAALGVLTALWGWFGWLVIAWIVCMVLDVFTGMAVGAIRGKWSSRIAREGLWHKAGSVAAVAAAGVLDLVVRLLLEEAPGLPFEYTVFLCPLAVVWYLLTEAGSVIENAGAMGAPVPEWLRRAIAELRDRVDEKK